MIEIEVTKKMLDKSTDAYSDCCGDFLCCDECHTALIKSAISASDQIQDLIKNNKDMIDLMKSILDAYENADISHEQFRIKTAEFITAQLNDMGIKTKAQKWIEDNLI